MHEHHILAEFSPLCSFNNQTSVVQINAFRPIHGCDLLLINSFTKQKAVIEQTSLQECTWIGCKEKAPLVSTVSTSSCNMPGSLDFY